MPRLESVPEVVDIDAMGRVAVGGRTYPTPSSGSKRLWVTRLTSFGYPDATFDGDGHALLPWTAWGPKALSASTSGLALIGIAPAPQVFTMTSSGTIDMSFMPTELASFVPIAVARQSDGKLLLLSQQQLVRVDSSGAIDTSFGSSGWVDLATVSGASLLASEMLLDGSERIYVREGGTFVRYSTAGQLDLSFGGGTVVMTSPFPAATAGPYAAVTPAGDHLYLAIGVSQGSPPSSATVILHATEAGWDSSYGGAGYVLQHDRFGDSFIPSGIAVQATGNVLILGTDELDTSVEVVRLDSSGSVDPSFASNGWWVDGPNGPDEIHTPMHIAVANGDRPHVVVKRQYSQNLYYEANAVVCRFTP
ncbi:MAG: hypothetical protein AB7O24_23290 [Kofleriaceae bacterium]